MNVAVKVQDPTRAELRATSPEPDRGGPYLRSYRIQARPRVRPRVMALLLVAAALLFARVWEITVANALSMERDRLTREVRTLENRIRISRDLREQAALKEGTDVASLSRLGFLNPDPAQVVDIDLSERNPRAGAAKRGLMARIVSILRALLPASVAERVVGLPAASVRGGVNR